MVYLLKVLSDMLQSPQPFSQFQICPKPKVKLGPANLTYPVPLSSLDMATTRNLISSVSPMGSRSHRDGLANSLLPVAIISVSPRYAVGLTEFA